MNPKIFLNHLQQTGTPNNIIMRIAWSAALWNPNRLLIAKTLAEAINRIILNIENLPEDPSLKVKAIGFQ